QKLDYKVERPSQVMLLAKIEGPRRLLPDTATKMGRQALIGYIMERERVFMKPAVVRLIRIMLINIKSG
ncbi:hypothetical protein P5Z58_05120, partial [Limosilactobacillus mucosae]|nr:hypothetical protein [Limosilactobacillus mucosae]